MLERLRAKHPVLRFRSLSAEYGDGALQVEYRFLLEPDHEFRPRISIPVPAATDIDFLRPLLLRLGIVELISYWKAACPPLVVIEPPGLHRLEIAWWKDLFIHGLGEFFYRNDIDFSGHDFLEIETESSNNAPPEPLEIPAAGGQLIFVGGGKDSALSLELLRNIRGADGRRLPSAAMILNPISSAIATTKLAGYDRVLLVDRRIDPLLLELNSRGYLNGHTPFSAYLAFLGTVVAAANGYSRVIASNESSANEANTTVHGIEINHQYSKTVRFERGVRNYLENCVVRGIDYFSFLRPVNELQICKLFAGFPEYFPVFRSCNVGQKENIWCGRCPKCAFTYLCLFPFIETQTMAKIFRGELFQVPQIQKYIADLVGLGDLKPFECVGTMAESQHALQLCLKKAAAEGTALPEDIRELAAKLPPAPPADDLLNDWNGDHFLPPEYQKALADSLSRA